MATPIGTNEVNSLSRRYIIPTIYDLFYKSNLMFFRLNAKNKKMVQGGLQIEVPLMYQGFAAGGYYQGYDLLDVSPSDTVLNAAFDWKQAYVPVSVDGLTLIRADSPEQVVNFLSVYFEQAGMQLAEILGQGVWSSGTNVKSVDGIPLAVDNGTVTGVNIYGGLNRATLPFWAGQIDTTAATALLALQVGFGNVTQGGRHPTLGATTQAIYNRIWNLGISGQAFPVQPGAVDEQLLQAGFTNLVFNGVPIAVDSHIPANNFFWLNEDFMFLYVNPRADFNMKEFREPVNQDAMTSQVLWAGNLVVANPALQYRFYQLTS
jgi:hypothetical protein